MAQKRNKMSRREEKEGVYAETYNGLKGFVWAKAHMGCTTFVRVNSVYPEFRVWQFWYSGASSSSFSHLLSQAKLWLFLQSPSCQSATFILSSPRRCKAMVRKVYFFVLFWTRFLQFRFVILVCFIILQCLIFDVSCVRCRKIEGKETNTLVLHFWGMDGRRGLGTAAL